MLFLDRPIGPIEGLVVYRDHQDPNQFYYIPERPRLARNDGVPEFTFIVYSRDITDNPDFTEDEREEIGGGLLSFTVDLSVDDQILDTVKDELAEFSGGGEVALAPVQFRSGSVRLSITEDAAESDDAPEDIPSGMTFVEKVYGASKPSLFGFNRATFTVVLPQESALLFEASFRSGISPIGVIYDLEFLGMRPAFDVRITAEYERIYEHLEAEFAMRGQIQAVSIGANIAAAFQKLRDEGVIKVEVLNFTDDKDLRKRADEAFNWFKTQLLKDFFKSSLETPAFMNNRAAGGNLLGSLNGLLSGLTGSQQGSSTPQRGRPTNEEPTTAGQPTSLDSNTRDTSEAPAAETNGGGGRGRDGGGSSAASGMSPFQVGFTLKALRQEELKKRVFEYSMQAAVARDAAPQGLFSTLVENLDPEDVIQRVELDDDFFDRVIADVSVADLSSAGVSSLTANFEYPGTREEGEPPEHADGFEFSSESTSVARFQTFVNDDGDRDYRYRMDVHFDPSSDWVGKSLQRSTAWKVSRSRRLTLSPLEGMGLLLVEVSLGDFSSGQISQVQVELKYEDAANDFQASKTFLLRPGEAADSVWKIRLEDETSRAFRFRTTYVLKNNTRITTDWHEQAEPTLTINEPFQNEIDLRLTPSIQGDGLVEAVIDIDYEDAENNYAFSTQEVFTPSSLSGRNVTIPVLREDPGPYRYQVTIVREDGSFFQSEMEEREAPVIVVTDDEGVTRDVDVRPADTSLADHGLAAVKAILRTQSESPDVASVVFTPSQLEPRTVSLASVTDDRDFPFDFEVLGYTSEGDVVEGESGTQSDDHLVVPLPDAP